MGLTATSLNVTHPAYSSSTRQRSDYCQISFVSKWPARRDKAASLSLDQSTEHFEIWRTAVINGSTSKG